MRVARLRISNFRGIKAATVLLPSHAVLIGDNNTGKTTVLEAIDLVLGPDRLNRQPPIDEHDFFRGKYIAKSISASGEGAAIPKGDDSEEQAPQGGEGSAGGEAEHGDESDVDGPLIEIEVTIAELTEEQIGKFGDYAEFWDSSTDTFYDEPIPDGVDATTITEALRITFRGWYDPEEDDFEGRTYFTRSLTESENPELFSKKHKQICGFLYLRSLRTGSRALSLERGSLLDIILRLKEVRPQMWEDTISNLANYSVAADPKLGISGVLESINSSLKKYVPKEWGIEPHLKVSSLTREHLRKIITAFIATGEGTHAAPFYRQGTGTINMLVLAMLSQIAADKQNVIFAMEEPETAIPPYAQKRIVHEIRQLAAQAIFTSHSPYVLEEFALDETIVLGRDAEGVMSQSSVVLPKSIKLKAYRQNFRTRFSEGLLARRILVAEGATEAAAFPVVCRRLAELNSVKYASLEALGICVIDAGGESNVPDMAKLYRELGKRTFAICDKQSAAAEAVITAEVDILLMHSEKGFEDLVLLNTTEVAMKRFAKGIDWPPHLTAKYPDIQANAAAALSDYFGGKKADWGIADFLAQCSETEIPEWLRDACIQLKDACDPGPADATDEPGDTTDAAD